MVAFGQILPKALLDIPPQGCINVHASLLPRYRGAAPLNWCIINGETETGVTTMLMDLGLDTGDMLLARKTPLDENEDIESLHDRMSVMGAELLAETLDRLVAGDLVPQPQNNADSCYAPMLKKEDGIINWHADARTIHNQVRGLARSRFARASSDVISPSFRARRIISQEASSSSRVVRRMLSVA